METANNPMPEITRQLKKLHLSGMLEALGIRNKEAIQNKLLYTEFFARLVQDETLRRNNKRFANRLKKSGLKGEKTIENFDFTFNPRVNQAEVKELATCQFIHEKAPVLIVGPCGTGKSHLAQAIGRCAIHQGIDVLFTTQSNLVKSLQAAAATDDYEKALEAFIKPPLLIMDDFALKPMRTPQDEYVHDMVAGRYETGATVVTSNLDFSEWSEGFQNRLLGAATVDRLRHGAYSIVLEGESYRRARSKNKQDNNA